VDLFFILSGFLIGGILMDQRESENYFKAFYIRRCCRILPPYLLLLASYLILKSLLAVYSSSAWFQELFTDGGMPFWANLTFCQNYVSGLTGHYNPDWLNVNWSLAMEEQFYLVLPLAIWLVRPSFLVKILVVPLGLHPWVQLFLGIFYARAFIAAGCALPVRADALLIGVICAFAIRQENFRSWLSRSRRGMNGLFIFLLLGLIWVLTKYDLGTFEYERILFFNLWVALFYACLVLVAVSYKQGIIARAMRFPPLRKLGAISYSVYLFHLPINGLLHGLLLGKDRRYRDGQDVLVSVAAVMLTLFFSSLLWWVLEKPVIAWGHSFPYGRQKRSAGK
jgi:peptidoglycan/LPS O-acetylase OafA/YrhL